MEICPGCSLYTEPTDGPVHKYLESSPACWSKFGEILAREYENFEYMSVHGLTVDAYALQHPGQEGPQTTNSAYVHLGSLYSYFVLGNPVGELSNVKQDLTKHKSAFRWLKPPERMDKITVADVLQASSASEHKTVVIKWAAYIFEQWADHHSTIAELLTGGQQ